MSKRKKSRKIKAKKRNRQILKILVAVFLIITVAMILPISRQDNPVKSDESISGVWISYADFKTLGLYNKSENDFRENADHFLEMAEEHGINAVFFHVRAFRDAAYDSDYFPTAAFVWDRDETIDYDPLEIMVELTHKKGMALHAWMNPYRNASFEEDILDPSLKSTTDEILLCVEEVIDNYDVDGIHFDDYFYEEGNELPESEKMENVNRMVKAVYDRVHKSKRDLTFGISPAGNTSYCRSIGADIDTWMTEDGYVDYIVPQIYWTDEHTAPWRDDMFSDTLEEWCCLKKNDVDLYIGIALYKAGTEDPDDPGWQDSNDVVSKQIMQIKDKDCEGYILFSAGDFYRNSAAEELSNYRNLVL